MIFKDIQYCQKFKEIGGHHEENLKLKQQLLFLPVYLSKRSLILKKNKNIIMMLNQIKQYS